MLLFQLFYYYYYYYYYYYLLLLLLFIIIIIIIIIVIEIDAASDLQGHRTHIHQMGPVNPDE